MKQSTCQFEASNKKKMEINEDCVVYINLQQKSLNAVLFEETRSMNSVNTNDKEITVKFEIQKYVS